MNVVEKHVKKTQQNISFGIVQVIVQGLKIYVDFFYLFLFVFFSADSISELVRQSVCGRLQK